MEISYLWEEFMGKTEQHRTTTIPNTWAALLLMDRVKSLSGEMRGNRASTKGEHVRFAANRVDKECYVAVWARVSVCFTGDV